MIPDTIVEWLIVLADCAQSAVKIAAAAAVSQALRSREHQGSVYTEKGINVQVCNPIQPQQCLPLDLLTHQVLASPTPHTRLRSVFVCIPDIFVQHILHSEKPRSAHFRNTVLCVPFLNYGIVMHNNVSSCSCNILMTADFMQFARLHVYLKLRCY